MKQKKKKDRNNDVVQIPDSLRDVLTGNYEMLSFNLIKLVLSLTELMHWTVGDQPTYGDCTPIKTLSFYLWTIPFSKLFSITRPS